MPLSPRKNGLDSLIKEVRVFKDVEKGGKTPTPQDFSLTTISSLLRTENGLTTDILVVKCTGRGLVVKRPGVLSKVQMLNLVLGVGVFSLLPIMGRKTHKQNPPPKSRYNPAKMLLVFFSLFVVLLCSHFDELPLVSPKENTLCWIAGWVRLWLFRLRFGFALSTACSLAWF